MEEDINQAAEKREKNVVVKHGGSAGAGMVYILGLIGAAVYYIGQAGGDVGQIVIGMLKALIWPALLVYKALEFLQM